MKKQRRVLWCLLLITAVFALHGHVGTTDVFAADSTATEQEAAETLDIVSGWKSSYVIITPKTASTQVETASRELRDAIQKKTGVSLKRKNDLLTITSKASETEILIGYTNRAESAEVMQDVPYGEYAIRVVGKKVVIAAWDETSLQKACEVFAEYVQEKGKFGSLTLASDYTASGDTFKGVGAIPHYEDKGITTQYIDLADGSCMLYVANTSRGDFVKYVEGLSDAGFTEFSFRQAGKMLYAIYNNEETILHASFNTTTREARIAADKAYDMTIFTDTEYEKVCEPTVSLVGQEVEVSTGWIYNAMCLVFRAEDGRFIIVDGGYGVFSVNKLYKTLRSLHVNDGKITIAAWIMTHAHSDHTGAFQTLSNTTMKKRIVVENFIHHFSTDAQHEAIGSAGTSQKTRTAMKGYRDANIIKAHSGQVIQAGGMEIEMLFTYADMEPAVLDEMNTTSLVFRVTARDNSIMVLGDASNRSLNYLCNIYGDYLKSDMVQIAHHGYNGVAKAYEWIDADVVLWPGGVRQFYGREGLYRIKDWKFNKKALDLAEEAYIAGDDVYTLILPYTPEDWRSVTIYDGEN